MADVYQIITDRIIEKLTAGTIPWRKPWTIEPPKNFVTRHAYRGINVFLLGSSGYSSPYWLTYRQAQTLGGQVRRGERATPVVFWKIYEKENGREEEKRRIPVARYYSVFNTNQVDGLQVPEQAPFVPNTTAEEIVKRMPNPPKIEYGLAQASYNPRTDTVRMPDPLCFHSSEGYYAVKFHELAHATGAPSRLHRFETNDNPRFGSTDYSLEELIAEMTASFLAGHAGITQTTIENSASYIDGWLEKWRARHLSTNHQQLIM